MTRTGVSKFQKTTVGTHRDHYRDDGGLGR